MMDSSTNKSEVGALADTSFDDIRPLYDAEVKDAIDFLLNDRWFRIIVEPLIAPIPWDDFSEEMRACEKIIDFQKKIIYTMIYKFVEGSVKDLELLNPKEVNLHESHTYISNHRDIILDAGLFNIILHGEGYETTEIAIGDNLLIYPWITTLVKLNKSFIVKRNIPIREVLKASEHLSQYIHKTITKEKQSVWIAQREGRAKDSDDRTQASVLKMLTLANRKEPIESLKSLDIVPLSISYEYDPCDFLKAKEFQLKRDNTEYKKTDKDDLINMFTGIEGYKGRVSFKIGSPLNESIDTVSSIQNRSTLLQEVASIIDNEIFKNYEIFIPNYIAYDLMLNTDKFNNKYTAEEKAEFIAYVTKQVGKVNIDNKDDKFLGDKIIEMYANTLINHLSAID